MNISKLWAKSGIFLLGLVTSSLASAHPGDHSFHNIIHFLTEPDHVAVMAVVVVVGVLAFWKLRKDSQQDKE